VKAQGNNLNPNFQEFFENRDPEISDLQKSLGFLKATRWRRSVRQFDSRRKIDSAIIFNAIRAASTSPSGANREPWLFGVVDSPEVKSKIRSAAEEVEKEFYQKLAPDEMLEALKPFKTNEKKSHLEDASHLIVIFAENYSFDHNGQKRKNYYVKESVCIATGILISALTYSGICTLTHTPQPALFLNEVLNVESRFKPVLVLACGYPSQDLDLPNLIKKPLEEICFLNNKMNIKSIHQA
jgi:nitroreductase